MRRSLQLALCAILPAALLTAQQAIPPTQPPAANAQPAAQTVYYAGPGVTAPELLPISITDFATGRCKHLDGSVVLSAVIDAAGMPRDVDLFYRSGLALDEVASRLVKSERFRPGTFNGAPAAVAVEIELDLEACVFGEHKDESGNRVASISLRSFPNHLIEIAPKPLPEAKSVPGVGPLALHPLALYPGGNPTPREFVGGISPPVPIYQPQAQYSDQARKTKFQGLCLVSLIVDARGSPQNVHVIKSLTPDLDQKAIEAVSKYRFEPARKKDGTPVPVMITVEVDFHLY